MLGKLMTSASSSAVAGEQNCLIKRRPLRRGAFTESSLRNARFDSQSLGVHWTLSS